MVQNILREDIEYVIHCDTVGKIIGPISKKHAHISGVIEKLTHYTTWSMIYNKSTGKYGIQRKNPRKHYEYSAGKWDMGVAGHNCYSKEDGFFRPLDFDENLIKEAKEEIGINIKMSKSKEEFIKVVISNPNQSSGYIFDKFHYNEDINNEWVGLGFIVVFNEDVNFKDNEVVDFKWLSPEEFKVFLDNNDDYCTLLPFVFEKAERFRKESSI